MVMGKDSPIVRVESGWGYGEGAQESGGGDCPSQGKAEEGNPGGVVDEDINVFNGQNIYI